MIMRAAPAVLLALAVLFSGAAAGLAIRLTRAPGDTGRRTALRGRLLPFLTGATVVAGVLLMLARVSLSTRLPWTGAATPDAAVALAVLGAGASAALLMALNALVHPRGLHPAWVLVLAAPFLVAQAVVPLLALAPPPLAAGMADELAAALAGAAAGTIGFLATLVAVLRTDTRARLAAGTLAAAAALQAFGAATLTAGNATGISWTAAADALTGIALVLALLWGPAAAAAARQDATVTLRPTG